MNNNFSSAIPLPSWLIFLLAISCLLFLFKGLQSVLRKAALAKKQRQKIFILSIFGVIVWMVLLGILAWNGFFLDFSKVPPRPGFTVLLPLPFILLFAFSKTGTRLLKVTPPQWLIFMQSFRILVELILFFAFIHQLLPVQMTFGGKNFDVLSGLLALPTAYFCFVKKSLPAIYAITYNVVGLLLLMNILLIAVLSMPTPWRSFMNEPANTIVGTFPFIYLPGVLVPIAYGLHILSLRQLTIREDEI